MSNYYIAVSVGQSDNSKFCPCFPNKKAKQRLLIVYHLVDKSTHTFIVFIKAFVSVRDAKTLCLQTNETEGTFSHWYYMKYVNINKMVCCSHIFTTTLGFLCVSVPQCAFKFLAFRNNFTVTQGLMVTVQQYSWQTSEHSL